MGRVFAGTAWMLAVATIACVGHGLIWGQSTDSGQLPELISTRQNVFQIPFRIGSSSNPATRPVEIQLFVSLDRGLSWRPFDRTTPDQTSFNFRAPQDGEYWFFVRTLDASGGLRPGGRERPELRVLVDTQPPQMKVTAQRGTSGEVVAQITVDDLFVEPSSLYVEYRSDDQLHWQAVAVSEELTPDANGHAVATLRWMPPECELIEVRAEVVDRAGNPAVCQARTGAENNQDVVAQPPFNSQSNPISPPGTPHALGVAPPGGNSATTPPAMPSDVAGSITQVQRPAPQPQYQPFPQASIPTRKSSVPWPANNAPPLERSLAQARVLRLPTVDPFAERNQDFTVPESGGLTATSGPGSQNIMSFPLEDIVSRPAPPIHRSAHQDAAGGIDQAARMVNSRRFDLDYDVESLGPWGIRKVELWGTRDGGQSWQIYGVDEDNRSPITARVPDEGVYGFRILVQSGRGLIDTPPKPGDQPEVWVGVDLTPPTGEIVSTEQGPEGGATELRIRWQADDLRLADRPISLKFAETPAGPWFPIAGSLPNSGHYVWHLDNRVPDILYLRLEIRDAAGNQHAHTTPQGVRLERMTPRGRIKDVRPRTGMSGEPNPYYR